MTYFSKWGLFTWLVLLVSFLQIRFGITTNGVLKITAHKAETKQEIKQSVDLLSGLLVAAEEDNGADDDEEGGDCDDNANDGT